jgi:hypothetical protein
MIGIIIPKVGSEDGHWLLWFSSFAAALGGDGGNSSWAEAWLAACEGARGCPALDFARWLDMAGN